MIFFTKRSLFRAQQLVLKRVCITCHLRLPWLKYSGTLILSRVKNVLKGTNEFICLACCGK